jgi:hypothetical protein
VLAGLAALGVVGAVIVLSRRRRATR